MELWMPSGLRLFSFNCAWEEVEPVRILSLRQPKEGRLRLGRLQTLNSEVLSVAASGYLYSRRSRLVYSKGQTVSFSLLRRNRFQAGKDGFDPSINPVKQVSTAPPQH